MNEVKDSSTESESEDQCPARSIHLNSPNYSEPVQFRTNGYEATPVNSKLGHQLVKYGHQWDIDDIDEDGIILKAYIADEDLINFLRTQCHLKN